MKFFLPLTLLLVQLSSTAGEMRVDDENFAYAETQVTFKEMLWKFKLSLPMGSSGTGVFVHAKNTTDPRSDHIPRPNFDTLYSGALVDLTKPALLSIVGDERYQSVLVVTEEHWMPDHFVNTNPDSFVLTEESMGSKYVMLLGRTLVNPDDYDDLLEAYALQRTLALKQTDKGKYKPTEKWDEDSLTETRNKFIELKQKKTVTSAEMFGPNDGTITQENHNIGVAVGWGGNPPQVAVYEDYSGNAGPYKFILKNVPVRAFWSVTVYDAMGFVQPHKNYHLNSAFANKEDDGSYVIDFVYNKDYRHVENMPNLLATYGGWNFCLRLYDPEDEILDGTWVRPELKVQHCIALWKKDKCNSMGCHYVEDEETGKYWCRHRIYVARELCDTKLSAETCTHEKFVCEWNEEEGCKPYSCRDKERKDCRGDCDWRVDKCKPVRDTKKISMIVADE